jgi:hypothetical protein
VHSYIGAVISMVVVLLTIDHWTFEVAAFPVFIVCMGSVQCVLVGLEPGPRLRRARGLEPLAEPVSATWRPG